MKDTINMFAIYYDSKFDKNISNLACTKPNPNRKYIKTLLKCRDDFKTLQEIYPETKYITTREINKLWKLGYIQKYGNFEYLISSKPNTITFEITPTVWHTLQVEDIDKYKKVYYKITEKGEKLLKSIGL